MHQTFVREHYYWQQYFFCIFGNSRFKFFFSNTLDFLHRQRVRASSRLNGARGGRAPNPVPVAPATQNIAQNPAPAQNPRAMAAAAFAMAEVRG